jgi:hypothetical protein
VKGDFLLLFGFLRFLVWKLEPERHDEPSPGDRWDLARDVPLVFEHRRMGRRREDNVRVIAVIKLCSDSVRKLGDERLVIRSPARTLNLGKVVAKKHEVTASAGPMPGDLGECRLAGDELVNALPLVRLAVEVDDVEVAGRANADVVATLRPEVLLDVAFRGVVVPPGGDGRLFAGIGSFRPGAVYRINVELEFVPIVPERLGHAKLVNCIRDAHSCEVC